MDEKVVLSLVVYPLLELLVKQGGFKQGQVPKTDGHVPDLVVLVADLATVSLVPVISTAITQNRDRYGRMEPSKYS